MKHQAYLGLGSNLGDRQGHLQAAVAGLPPAVRVLALSSIYTTPPWGYLDQPAFLNQVALVETDLEPKELLRYLKRIEGELGRRPTFRYGPRAIDLDILLFDDLVVHSRDLTLPHPGIPERAFVLVPLAELAPGLRHPQSGRTVAALLEEVDTTGVSKYATAGRVPIDHPGLKDYDKGNPANTRTTQGRESMSTPDLKPLHWSPEPGVGYSVERRPDGGMNVIFTDISPETWENWRAFALQHLIDSDRLTRNLYDLRQIEHIPEEAIPAVIEASSDPAARNIRLAVVVGNRAVYQVVKKIIDLTPPGSAEFHVFEDVKSAEAWLQRPLDSMT
jgi:2-amino-4-hydroxy-6-hydroxymethyldihydropteridine diphosphokinase